MKLFCVPFADGSATIYRIWKKYLSLAIELIPVGLARRDNRPNEPFYKKTRYGCR